LAHTFLPFISSTFAGGGPSSSCFIETALKNSMTTSTTALPLLYQGFSFADALNHQKRELGPIAMGYLNPLPSRHDDSSRALTINASSQSSARATFAS
jgi:hypothetical protein